MNRKEFLEMCQKCAVLPKGIHDVRLMVPPELRVKYKGIAYYPLAYNYSFTEQGKNKHTAILHDMLANSIVYADLEEVEKYV